MDYSENLWEIKEKLQKEWNHKENYEKTQYDIELRPIME